MIDFTENIDSLEKMVWNFVLNTRNDVSDLKPSNHDSLRKEELMPMIKPSYFNDDVRQESFKAALKFFKEYERQALERYKEFEAVFKEVIGV